ncbi:MAG: hypothetical protein CMI54_05655 [Parcubacteria group bacterium]|jgi:hypothetical protein|nr:hypothetical protein [Parcubacteria group bacterium]|tara:strand:+ start:10726 stop:12693 length:1968 start_codon:yes stop_codon:yes gene_type:complete
MRKDAIGFFWADTPKTKVKAEPPERTWEAPDYLPNFEEASAFKYDELTNDEIVRAAVEEEKFLLDIEVYENYLLILLGSIKTGKTISFEMTPGKPLDTKKLLWVLKALTTITFNGNFYDFVIINGALQNNDNRFLKMMSDRLIIEKIRANELLREYKIPNLKFNTIDLREVAPGTMTSLKIYAGRIHAKRLADLPFHPNSTLTPPQIIVLRWYCYNDLSSTFKLYMKLQPELDLRIEMGKEYNTDLRSKSDAQIAEKVISKEIKKLTGKFPKRPDVFPGKAYKYNVPHFVKFETPVMQNVLETIRNAPFIVKDSGSIALPEQIKELKTVIGTTTYKVGIGGLHSCEDGVAHREDEDCFLVDRDVVSYYPRIILNQGLYPEHLGQPFLDVYRSIVERRLEAKARGDKIISESLKITINGSFGKLGSKYSILYSPQLLIQVTLTGQLSLLMLIELLETRGIPVVSANTDGVVIKCPRTKKADLDAIIKYWEYETSFETEASHYKALLSRDVNNYTALKNNGSAKGKGTMCLVSETQSGCKNNPVNEICIHAIRKFLCEGVPVDITINSATDISDFITLRSVRGGAVKDGEYLGKVVRWYYSTNSPGIIIYAASGNAVPRSEGAKPLMMLPDSIPEDLDRRWYIDEALKMIDETGYNK